MNSLITDELRQFMMGSPRVVKVATHRKNGRPWVQPVWFILDSDQLVFVISEGSLLARALQRDHRLAVCVDEEEVPYSFAVLEGQVETFPDSPDRAEWQEKLIRRYRNDVGNPKAHAQMLSSEYGGLLTRMTVHKVYFEPVVAPAPKTETTAS